MRTVQIMKHGTISWTATEDGKTMQTATSREACIRKTSIWAEGQGEPIVVQIYDERGHLEEERTHPPVVDPDRSPGRALGPDGERRACHGMVTDADGS